MRTIPAPELALWTDGDTAARELRVRVKRPEEVSFTNLSATLGGDWVLGVRSDGDTPDQPAGRFVVRLLKHATEGSLSPGLSAEPINLDASAAFRPLIHPGRHIEIDVRVSSEPWRLWLKGQVEDVDWAGSEVVATCLTLDGVILATQIEEEEERGAPDPGTAVETEIQGLLTRWMTSPPTLVTVGTPGWGVGPYIPPLGSLGEQIRTLAQRNGWDVRYKWNETAGDFRLTLYLPDRDKTVADFPLGIELMQEVAGLRISRQYVRNRVIVRYTNAAGVEQTPVELEDAGSIAEYGVLAMPIRELSEDSPIKDSTAATALAQYALSDLAVPLADGRWRIPFLPWLELHDLLALQADDDHYDFDTDFAVVGISHVVEPEGGWWTEVELRGGTPAGAFYSWHARTPRDAEEEAGEEFVLAPDGVIIPELDRVAGNASATTIANDAGASARLFAKKNAAVTEAEARAATARNGKVVMPGTHGAMVTGLDGDDVVYYGAFIYSAADGGGTESAFIQARAVYGVSGGAIPVGGIPVDRVDGDIVAELDESALNFGTDIAFSASDYNTVAWASGTLWLSDGVTSHAISAGNTGDMGAQTYIYWDAASPNVFQATSSFATAVGPGKQQVAVAWPTIDTGRKAAYVTNKGRIGINGELLGPNEVDFSHIRSISLTVLQAEISDLAVLRPTFTGGTTVLDSVTGNKISFRTSGSEFGYLQAGSSGGSYIGLAFAGDANWVFQVYKFSGGNKEVIITDADLRVSNGHILLSDGKEIRFAHGSGFWNVNSGNSTTDLHWSYNQSVRMRLEPDGSLYVDDDYYQFSPTPPFDPEQASAEDWLAWGMEDALKPHWDGKGALPTANHPTIREEATRTHRAKAEVAAKVIERHRKGVGKMAQAALRHAALRDAEIRAENEALTSRVAVLEAGLAKLLAALPQGGAGPVRP